MWPQAKLDWCPSGSHRTLAGAARCNLRVFGSPAPWTVVPPVHAPQVQAGQVFMRIRATLLDIQESPTYDVERFPILSEEGA